MDKIVVFWVDSRALAHQKRLGIGLKPYYEL